MADQPSSQRPLQMSERSANIGLTHAGHQRMPACFKRRRMTTLCPLFIESGSPWENGYIESFNGKLRDELLDREIFYNLREAKVVDRSLASALQYETIV
jgi:transposase InsO family protein